MTLRFPGRISLNIVEYSMQSRMDPEGLQLLQNIGFEAVAGRGLVSVCKGRGNWNFGRNEKPLEIDGVREAIVAGCNKGIPGER